MHWCISPVSYVSLNDYEPLAKGGPLLLNVKEMNKYKDSSLDSFQPDIILKNWYQFKF